MPPDRSLPRLSLRLLCVLAALVAVLGCARLPPLAGRSISTALEDTADTRLGRAVLPLARAHPGLSGVVPLPDGPGAFAARALLADAAERTLDVQYYIWDDDLSGTLLSDALRRAAERGVRVRLLLDDNGTRGLDGLLAGLDAHPRIEVRLFNPFLRRDWRVLDFLTDFPRLNRRMHNKSFTADSQVAIIGGRNVGDEYFGVAQGALFVDLDLLAVGPVVGDVSRDFDRYWASGSSYPVDRLLPPPDPGADAALADAAARAARGPAARAYMRALAASPFVRDLLAGRLPFHWAPARMISDDPAKGLGRATEDVLLWARLQETVGPPQAELELVSPYFVPGREGLAFLTRTARRGVQVVVLTNALEATDVPIVHAGYAKGRRALLKEGVTLFEMKRSFAAAAVVEDDDGPGLSGSSDSSLHAKTFLVDRARVFVGSFNFDPRSARLNTENGFVIDSPDLARTITETLIANLSERTYEVRLLETGDLQWVERVDGREILHDQEPGAGFWLRLGVAAAALLPIDWLL